MRKTQLFGLVLVVAAAAFSVETAFADAAGRSLMATATSGFVNGDVLNRASVSPSVCMQSNDCTYKCAAQYTLSRTSGTNSGTASATASVPGCGCYSGTAIFSTDSSATVTFPDGTQASVIKTGCSAAVAVVVNGQACTGTYDIANCGAAPAAPAGFVTGDVLERTSVAPSTCVQPNDCNYKCAIQYTLTRTGSSGGTATPGTVAGCTCLIGAATFTSDSAATVSFPGGSSATIVKDGCSASVVATVSGVTCSGTYRIKGCGSNSATGLRAASASALFVAMLLGAFMMW